jgi:hypothetical protein
MVRHEPGQVLAFAVPSPDRLINRIDDELASHRGRDRPAQDAAGVGIDDERGVAPARPRRDVGEVGNPKPVRRERPEVPVHQVVRLGLARVADRGAFDLAPHRASKPELGHEPFDGAARDRRLIGGSFAVQRQPDLPRPEHAVVGGVRGGDLGLQIRVPHLAYGRRAGAVLVVARRGDLAAHDGELLADRLDTPAQARPVSVLVARIDVLGDERHDQCSGRSSSAAKKAEAARLSHECGGSLIMRRRAGGWCSGPAAGLSVRPVDGS